MECPKIAAVQEQVTAAGEQKMLGVAETKVNAGKPRGETKSFRKI